MTRKTQKKLRKLLTLVSCAVLLVCVTVVGTIAYLTSTTKTVTNTFTVGNVNITLDEAKVDTNGKALASGERVGTTDNAEQKYHVFPGGEYDKDPTVTVKANSEEAYIRMIVTVSNYDNLKKAFDVTTDPFLLQNYVTGWNEDVWTIDADQITVAADDKSATYEFRYHETVSTIAAEGETAQDKALEDLFETVKIPEDIDNEHLQYLNNVQITVVAHAMQADGFANADAAWSEF